MAVSPRLELRQRQTLALTPAMRTSLGMLRLPTGLLAEELSREAAENPFLELRLPSSGSAYAYATETVAGQEGLMVSLIRQVDLQRLLPNVRRGALVLITELRSDGYLDSSLEEIAHAHAVPLPDLECGLLALQACEPTGVAARTLEECLSLQLIEKGYTPTRAAAVVARLEKFSDGRLRQLGIELCCDAAELSRIADDLRSLTPTPVIEDIDISALCPPELAVVKCADGALDVVTTSGVLPEIELSDLPRPAGESPELRALAERARLVTQALAARAATLLRVGRHIVATQPEFFLNNSSSLQPQSRAAAATTLGIHVSTLSRALAGKALTFEGKSLALSLFFSHALPTKSGTVSPYDVMARIRRLIAAEDPVHPVADEAICTHLQKEGVDIARRTVAKYRKCMRIPSSSNRRRRTSSEAIGPRNKIK